MATTDGADGTEATHTHTRTHTTTHTRTHTTYALSYFYYSLATKRHYQSVPTQKNNQNTHAAPGYACVCACTCTGHSIVRAVLASSSDVRLRTGMHSTIGAR